MNGSTMRHRRAVFLAITALLAATPAFAGPACYTPAEERAAKVRILQTELMVAALHCRDDVELGFPDKYNIFVGRFRAHLAEEAQQLKAYFERRYGSDSESRLDSFVTRIANGLSQDAQTTPNYCIAQVSLFDQVLALKETELESFSMIRPVTVESRDGC